MLGRPNWPEPVFMKSFAGAWLKREALQDLARVISSTIFAVCGKRFETHMPLWPCRLNSRRVPSRVVPWLLSMKANRLPSMNDCGIGWPFSSTSFGL